MLARYKQRRKVRKHGGEQWALKLARETDTPLTAALARADLHEREIAASKIRVDSPLTDEERARAHTWDQRLR